MTASSTSALVKGGYLKHPDPTRISFTTHNVPIVHHNSRIIAVCGIAKEWSDPASDGWFFSDFFALNYLMRGMGASQTWIATSSAEDLVRNYKEFLHGNPYQDRKVVLNDTLLQRGEITPVTVTAESDLHYATIEVLYRECRIAESMNAPVLLFLFSHGDPRTYGVELGTAETLLTIDEVRCIAGNDIGLTIISTACLSGGWSASTTLNATTSTAAGPTIESESWSAPPSVSQRHCGSIYATALINTLIDASSPLVKPLNGGSSITGSIQPQSPTAAQTQSFNEFARSIHDSLLDIDRSGNEHGISFSAQDDNWETSWTGRTGVPLRAFADRWEQLETRDPGSALNRSTRFANASAPADTTLSLQEFRGLSPGRLGSLFGGSPVSQKRHIKCMAKALLQTCPGYWTRGYGPRNRSELSDFILSPDTEFNNTAYIFCMLKYRFDILHYADLLIARLGIPKPESKYCFEFSWNEWDHRVQNTRGEKVNILSRRCFRQLSDSTVFQRPMKDQGQVFLHPQYYVTAAIVDASQTLNEVEAYLAKVFDMTNLHMRTELDHVLRESSVRAKGASWIRSIGRTMRDLSPIKQENSCLQDR